MKNNKFIIYRTADENTTIAVVMEDGTLWLELDQITELFQTNKSTVSRHIKNIFNEGELIRSLVVKGFLTTAAGGKTHRINYFNLDVIISVGYRVNSLRATQFRIWTNHILKGHSCSPVPDIFDRYNALSAAGKAMADGYINEVYFVEQGRK